MRRIAFFGGSFDPPHRGHLAIATAAADQFALDTVLFAPAASQPFKLDQPVTPFIHRYAMTVLATQSDSRFVPSLLDAPPEDAPQIPNYTVQTLQRLLHSLQDAGEPTQLFTLLGADSWSQIARWHAAPQLLALTDWIVAARPGFPLTGTKSDSDRSLPAGVTSTPFPADSRHPGLTLHHPHSTTTRVFFLPELSEDIAATDLRAQLDPNPLAVPFAVPFAVPPAIPSAIRDYILKACLYASPSIPT